MLVNLRDLDQYSLGCVEAAFCTRILHPQFSGILCKRCKCPKLNVHALVDFQLQSVKVMM